MGKRKDLSEFDKGQIVMARRLGQSISKTSALVGCSRSAVVSIYQKWSLGPAIHVDVTLTRTTYLSIVSWKHYSLLAVASFSRIMRHQAKMVQEWFEEHNNEFEVLT
ncbi:hypothetical protein DPX16_21732 [Anabarilius grahami]|uniref:Uncharacterized protein n=1 Tax=Anabarilius grahami TaxID=495550 RepID=A0A3N0YL89_ANAGA|nr:hypothetical protein DPX16_21732 [Anabarilius grahami]